MIRGTFRVFLLSPLNLRKKRISVSGTLFSKKDPWIVRIDNFNVEIVPEGTMLFMHNNDKPGVIGNIGTVMGKNNINIARMHFRQGAVGCMAISVVNIDSPVNDKVLDGNPEAAKYSGFKSNKHVILKSPPLGGQYLRGFCVMKRIIYLRGTECLQ